MPDTVDFGAITARQQATWATGDFHVIGRQVVPVSEALVASADPLPGSRVLDVACGSGNAALIAARRYCEVTGIDYVPALIERARVRAEADAVTVDFREADAQALPFDAATFDCVLSTFGVMFAPDQEKSARELARVCKPGGTIALANWTPEGYGGDFFGVHVRALPPPAGMPSPLRWGSKDGLDALLGPWTDELRVEKKTATFYFKSIPHMIAEFEAYFGPSARVVGNVDAAARERFEKELAEVLERYDDGAGGTTCIVADYLEVLAVRNDRKI